jgi:hypothetical protein
MAAGTIPGHWPLVVGRTVLVRWVVTQTTEVNVFLATNGWWPWLLLYAGVIIIVGCFIAYFVKRRRTSA